jgi:HupE / UreJ protein
MTEFQAYLILGFHHITDLQGYDHILFIMALCAVYQLKEWKRVLILITAFTVGHSITLALATLKILTISSKFIEFLIPITIIITALSNLSYRSENQATATSPLLSRYFLAGFFGLIHGLGFSNFLRSMLSRSQSLFEPLLAFNIGLEIGQILIVLAFFMISALLMMMLKGIISFKAWQNTISIIVAMWAGWLLLHNEFLLSLGR